MPLGKARDAERKRLERKARLDVQPVKPKIAELQAMIHRIEEQPATKQSETCSPPVMGTPIAGGCFIPWYNPDIHTTGDKVKQFRNGHVEVVTL